MIGRYLNFYKSSKFTQDAMLLTLGTIVAQALPFIFYPVFGRIYTPAQFGLLATISAIVPILAIVASGTYENGVLLASDKKEAASLVIMILIRSFLILLGVAVLMEIFSVQISHLLNEPELSKWMFVAPVCAFATVIYNCFNEWCVTNKYFASLSVNKIINTSSVALGKLGFGFSIFSASGLILGDILGRLISAVSCLFRALQMDKASFNNVKRSELLGIASKHKNLPKLLMPDQILN